MKAIIEKIPRGPKCFLKVSAIICLIVFVPGRIPDRDRVLREAIKDHYGLELPPMIAIRIGEFKGREEHVVLLLGQVSDSQMEMIEKEAAGNAKIYSDNEWFSTGGFFRKMDYGRFGYEMITILKSRTIILMERTRNTVLRARIEELEEQLRHEKMRAEAYNTMIDLAESTFKVPIRKKSGAKR